MTHLPCMQVWSPLLEQWLQTHLLLLAPPLSSPARRYGLSEAQLLEVDAQLEAASGQMRGSSRFEDAMPVAGQAVFTNIMRECGRVISAGWLSRVSPTACVCVRPDMPSEWRVWVVV